MESKVEDVSEGAMLCRSLPWPHRMAKDHFINAEAGDVLHGGESIRIFIFSSIADLCQKLGIFDLEDLRTLISSEAIVSFQITDLKDTSNSRRVIIHLQQSCKDIFPPKCPLNTHKIFIDEQDTMTSIQKFNFSQKSIKYYLKNGISVVIRFASKLLNPIRRFPTQGKTSGELVQDLDNTHFKQHTKLLLMLERGQYDCVKFQLENGFPLTPEEKEALLSEAIIGGFTDIVELLLQRDTCVSSRHLALAAKYGRVHTAKLLMKKKQNTEALQTEAGYYGNNAVVRLTTKHSHKLPFKSSSQENWIESEDKYNKEWIRVTKKIFEIKDVQKLREFIVNHINFIHYQDENGLTPLHLAAHQGRETCVRELLDHGALPIALTKDLKTPADLANSQGHREIAEMIEKRIRVNDNGDQSRSDVSKRYFQLLEAISMGGTFSANDVEDKRSRVDLVKRVASLLATGTPLEFHGSFIYSALLLAISTNSTPLLPLLLAAGAPLTATTSGLGPLQLAWITPGVTPWVSVVVARAIRLKLGVEMDFSPDNDNEHMLKSAILNLIQHLERMEPWKVKFVSGENDPEHLTQLLITACRRGATTSAWWVWQAGGSTCDLSKSALQAALDTEQPHLDTVKKLISHMGSNPFISAEDGSLLFSKIPLEIQKQLLQDSLAKEYQCLYTKMAKARHHRNSEKVKELQHLVILLIILYIQYERQGEEKSYPLLQDLLMSSELGLTAIQEEELHVSNEEWIASLIKKLDVGYEGKNSKDEDDDFSELTESMRLFSIRKQKCNEHIEHKQKYVNLLYVRALKLCSVNNLNAFLYLLATVAAVDVKSEVDPICGTRALHHAAMHGNLSIAMSLIHFGCSREARDRSGNTPSHYAFMAGHEEVAQFLTNKIENNRGLGPHDMFKGYQTYLDQQSLSLIRDERERCNDSKELIERHLDHLRETWEAKGGLSNTIKDIHVDFTKGESSEVRQAITDVVQHLISEIAEVNKFFDGELVDVGSAADDTRLFCPDEYDFNLVLKNVSGHPGQGLKIELKNSPESERVQKYIELSVERDELKDLMQGSNFTDTFYQTAKKCLKNLRLGDERLIFISPGIEKTQVGINLHMIWMGQEFPLLMIDVDIVPTVEAPWPQQLPQPLLTPSNMNTVYLSKMVGREWRFSFGFAENQIMSKLRSHERRVFLGCKLLLSSLKVSWWVPREAKRQFSFWDKRVFRLSVPDGFVLKNVFFEELQAVQDADLWTDDHLLDRMKSIFSRMCEDDNNSKYQMPRKVIAYFGGNTQLPSFAQGAPDILAFLCSLNKNVTSPTQF